MQEKNQRIEKRIVARAEAPCSTSKTLPWPRRDFGGGLHHAPDKEADDGAKHRESARYEYEQVVAALLSAHFAFPARLLREERIACRRDGYNGIVRPVGRRSGDNGERVPLAVGCRGGKERRSGGPGLRRLRFWRVRIR